MQFQEQSTVRALLNTVINEGQTYPQAQPLLEPEFAAYWMSHSTYVVRSVQQTPTQITANVLGAFYLKPNFPGRCSHISNAGFIVQPAMRGWGIGRFMGETMLDIARDQGYEAVMFNLVFATNSPSLNLWQSLGFETIGRIPHAVKLPNGEMTDALMLYRKL